MHGEPPATGSLVNGNIGLLNLSQAPKTVGKGCQRTLTDRRRTKNHRFRFTLVKVTMQEILLQPNEPGALGFPGAPTNVPHGGLFLVVTSAKQCPFDTPQVPADIRCIPTHAQGYAHLVDRPLDHLPSAFGETDQKLTNKTEPCIKSPTRSTMCSGGLP